nr:protein FAR1-RELATED SEQUENCE 5-like [Ziziphus jujuba var. spinosa]
MEKQMAEIYTRKIFLKFQDELWYSLVTMPQFIRENATHKMCVVKSSPKEGVGRVREIAYDKELDFASCTCKKFESKGLPYRHILAFLRLFGNIPLPNQYIMKRWTRGAKSQIITDKQGVEISKIDSIVSNIKSGGIFEKGSTAHDYEALKDPYAVRVKGCG